ncbi:MAG: hypothetical protein HY790_00660 [Deltaproteobacteria bacterium]|nr:hypothetical protein [Deltaproteobacteria bacterium]MBI4794355.1 hypothetical protein [Deltaproteobacteria bacterium]
MNFKGKAAILGLVVLLALATGALAQSQPLAWDGTQWKEFNQAIKVAYVKGVLNMASFETAMGGAGRAACVSRAFTEELKTKTLGQVIAEVDKFYKENPGKMKTPVIEVLMQRCTKLCPPEPPAKEKK